MVLCKTCKSNLNKNIDFEIKCLSCKKWHCYRCSNLTNDEIKANNKNFCCKKCYKPSNVRKSLDATEANALEQDISDPVEVTLTDESENNTNKLLKQVLAQLKLLSGQIEDLKTENSKFRNDLINKDLELKKFKTQMGKLETRIDKLEQEKRSQNIIVKNVPKCDGEDIEAVAIQLGRLCEIDLEVTDFETYRLSKDSKAPILIKFSDLKKKESMMKSIKKLRTVKLSMLGFTVTNDVDPVIFINDDLTPNKLNLLKKAKELQKKTSIPIYMDP